MGGRSLWHEIMQLERHDVEGLLGCPIPIDEAVYGIGQEDLAPLLEHLTKNRPASDPLMPLPVVSENKLDFNKLDNDSKAQLLRVLRLTYLIDEYYARGLDAAQLDNAAKELSIIYQDVRFGSDETEDVLWQLEMHILGNQSHRPQVQRAAWVIIAYFFERCDIFEAPPPHWQRTLPTLRGFE